MSVRLAPHAPQVNPNPVPVVPQLSHTQFVMTADLQRPEAGSLDH